MLIDVVTIFPEMFAPLEISIVGKAREKGLVEIGFFNPRTTRTIRIEKWTIPNTADRKEW